MNVTEVIYSYISVLITMFFFVLCYRETISTSSKKIKKSFIFYILIASILFLINNIFITNIIKLANVIVLLFVLMKFIFNEDSSSTLIKSVFLQLTYIVAEMVFMLILPLIATSLEKYQEMYLIKSLITLAVSLLQLLIYKNKKFINIFNKLLSDKKRKEKVSVIIAVLSISVSIIGFTSAHKYDTEMSMILLIIVFVFLILSWTIMKEFNAIKQAEEKEEILLKFITKYEKLIDINRINKHEILNNLLILKSIKNKNSKKYIETLNDIINVYQQPGDRNIASLYNLPSGLKGIFYYKLNTIEENNLNFTINVSSKVNKYLSKLNQGLYFKVCKCAGILIDNAIEASTQTKEKYVFVDVSLEKNKVVIFIENSFSNSVDFEAINNKAYSTKGKNRGYGLYILRDIIKSEDRVQFSQKIENNKFISELKIK